MRTRLRLESLTPRLVPAYYGVGNATIDGFTGPTTAVVGEFVPNTGADTAVAPNPGSGGGPRVVVYGMDGAQLASFYVYDPDFAGGISLGTVPGQYGAPAMLVEMPGPGGGPVIRTETVDGSVNKWTLAPGIDPSFRGGETVRVAEQYLGGPYVLLITPGAGGAPVVEITTPYGDNLATFYVGPADYRNTGVEFYGLDPTITGVTTPGGWAFGVDDPNMGTDVSTSLWTFGGVWLGTSTGDPLSI